MKRSKGRADQYAAVLRLAGRAFAAAPGFGILTAITSVLIAADNVLGNAMLVRYLYQALQREAAFSEILKVLLWMGLLLLLRYALRAWQEEAEKPRAKALIEQKIQKEIWEKATKTDIAGFDDPQFLNRLHLSTETAGDRALEALELGGRLLSYAGMLAGYLLFMAGLDAGTLIVTALFVAGTTMLDLRRVRWQVAKEKESQGPKRRLQATERIFTLPQYAAYLRSTHIRAPLLLSFQRAVKQLRETELRNNRPLAVLDLIGAFFLDVMLIDGGLYGYLTYRMLVSGTIDAGGLMSLAFSTENLTWRIQDVLSLLPEVSRLAVFAEEMETFSNAKSSLSQGERLAQAGGSLELENVRFRYPGAEKDTMRGLSLMLRPGEKVALVGLNGAGKTTLVKLLLHLYEPDEGRILYAAEPVQRYAEESYRALFGVLFQEFTLFPASLGVNVAMTKNFDQKRVVACLDKAGLGGTLFSVPLQTPVTREFDENGVMLSGGEAQKLALARLFYRDSPVWILDEPSSALDPLAEHEFSERLLESAKGKTVLLISHRLTAAPLCDRICVLQDGLIQEQGTHTELMRRDGLYRELFEKQALRYRAGKTTDA